MTGGNEFANLLVVALIAVAAPLLVQLVPRLRIPAVVIEIVAGIVVGPSLLGWVEADQPVTVLSLLGLVFLLFLAGMEIDLRYLRGERLQLPLVGYVVSLGIALALGLVFSAVDWVNSALFLAIVLSGTALGLVVPVLKDARLAEQPVGQLTIAAATVADFGAILLLSLFFSESEGSAASRVIGLAVFVVAVAFVGVVLLRAGRSTNLEAVLVRLQDTTAEIRIRIAVAVLVGFVALAATVGVETLLGAFFAGALFAYVDRDTTTHPHFRLKLEAIGFGFLIPVFFVTSGLQFDLAALTADPAALTRVPLFLLALLAVRGAPALLYRKSLGGDGSVVAGLLQATSLPFIVLAADIGVALGAVRPATASALIAAGLISVVAFPPMALARASRTMRVGVQPVAGDPTTESAT